MPTIQTHTLSLSGTSYEVGLQLGHVIRQDSALLSNHTAGMSGFGPAQVAEAAALFDRWCPGLNEELAGLADALAVRSEKLFYYSMTYLLPRCSHVALLSAITADGKPLLARNYEFSHQAEDFCLVRTAVTGKYAHLGTSVLHLGRDDGINEHGLAVTISSCGFPVGALPYMRAPKNKGLQFWAVTRALLENCRDVSEALACLEGMPIAYNLNLILLDRSGRAALFETLDGRRAQKVIEPDSAQQMLWATNHAVLPQLAAIEPQVMAHSARRYDYIGQQLSGKTGITVPALKNMLLAEYPNGLCCHYFDEFFGTTKSMLLSPADGTVELCWGGEAANGWRTYSVAQPLTDSAATASIQLKKAVPGTYDWLPLG